MSTPTTPGPAGDDGDQADLRDLFDEAPCGYLATTADARIVRCNRTLERWTGYDRDHFVGKRFPDLLNIAGKIYFETHFAPLLRMQGHFDEVALDLVRVNGTPLPVLVNARERRNAAGAVDFIRITIFNAVDRRRYENDLLAAREEARAANARLRDLADSLEARVQDGVRERLELEETLRHSQKMEAVGQLTGGLAHDFNNLLTGISGSLELLQIRMKQGRTGAEVARYIDAAQGAAKRAGALTHRLLAFSRRQTLDPKPTDVNRLIGDVEDLLRRSVEPTVSLEVVGASGLWPALVDANQLENALLNLCINARDAMPSGGSITIETANKWLDDRGSRMRDLPPGQYLSISVTDSGIGMSKDVVDRAFEPFFTTKPIGQGTGLGLSMVYGFARQSGGQVRLYSEVGRGTTVSIYLPRHRGSVSVAEDAAFDLGDAGSEHGETILIVDDEPTIRLLVMEVLDDLGYAAVEASDGASALRVLESGRRIDLLVTDIGLPHGMSGAELAEQGRALRPDLRVLFITGYADNAVAGDGRLARGTEILTKPFAIDELAHRIKKMVTGRSP